MKDLPADLIIIKMSLTDSVTNPNFEANRKFALEKLEKTIKLIDKLIKVMEC